MLATMGPVRLMCAGKPGRFYATVTAPRLSGIVMSERFCAGRAGDDADDDPEPTSAPLRLERRFVLLSPLHSLASPDSDERLRGYVVSRRILGCQPLSTGRLYSLYCEGLCLYSDSSVSVRKGNIWKDESSS